MEPLYLRGCRHDILGHYLKAIGLLRVLARCADQDHRDSDAEGWWDMNQACFRLRSEKYPTMEKLVEFFEKYYRPTPVFSPWNTGGGMDEKKQVVFSIDPKPWNDYWVTNGETLLAHGFPLPVNDTIPTLPAKTFDLKCAECSLPSTENVMIRVIARKGKKPKSRIQIAWSDAAVQNLFAQMEAKRATLEEGIKFTDAVKKKFVPGDSEFVFDVRSEAVLRSLGVMPGVKIDFRTRTGTTKTVMATLAEELKNDSATVQALSLGREFFSRFQADDADQRTLLEEFRDACPSSAVESLDAIFTTRSGSRSANNPLFLNRGMGEGGNDELFRKSREHYCAFRTGKIAAVCEQSLTGRIGEVGIFEDEIGTPFFPDAQKAYNIGTGWVQSKFPFNAFDYVLAAEGAFAMRGAVARTAAAGSKRFAAFPFVFDSSEPLEDGKNVTGTAGVLWFPIWSRKTTFGELASFISDAQARLPKKDASFSSEFVRALNSQGVDAGFTGWQEFRFKMKGSRVPWITTGRYVGASSVQEEHDTSRTNATLLNRGLAPLDETRFIDQFGLFRKPNGKYDKDGPHCVGAAINAAMETAAHEPTPHHCMALLESVFSACRQTCVSESFRKKLNGGRSGGRALFFGALPMKEWNELLNPLECQAEFRIARALASITGLERQSEANYSLAQPMLGSLLPLTLGPSGWFLPGKTDQTHQDVWTGSDLTCDLAAVLRRRYMDSLKDEQPALRAVHGAQLDDVLKFLRGGLDDHLIARWTEAMSLIGWDFVKDPNDVVKKTATEGDKQSLKEGIEPAYAALRTLLELECEYQGKDRTQWKKRRSQQPFALLCERSPSSLPLAGSEAFRWIGIWGVCNPWGTAAARVEKPRITGRYVIRLDQENVSSAVWEPQLADRLAAAVCIPLRPRDRRQLYKAVTLPPGI